MYRASKITAKWTDQNFRSNYMREGMINRILLEYYYNNWLEQWVNVRAKSSRFSPCIVSLANMNFFEFLTKG